MHFDISTSHHIRADGKIRLYQRWGEKGPPAVSMVFGIVFAVFALIAMFFPFFSLLWHTFSPVWFFLNFFSLSRRRPNHPYITPTTGIEAHGPTTVDLDIRNNVISLYLILYCTLVPISWGNAIFYTLTFLFTWGLHSVRCGTYIAFFSEWDLHLIFF